MQIQKGLASIVTLVPSHSLLWPASCTTHNRLSGAWGGRFVAGDPSGKSAETNHADETEEKIYGSSSFARRAPCHNRP